MVSKMFRFLMMYHLCLLSLASFLLFHMCLFPVCENCYELDPTFLGLAIILDILLTTFVIMAIFKCTNKKRLATPTHTSRGENVVKHYTALHSVD